MKKLLLPFPYFLGVLICLYACNFSAEKSKTTTINTAPNSVENQLKIINTLRKSNLDSALLLNQKLINTYHLYADTIQAEILKQKITLSYYKDLEDSTLFYADKFLSLQQEKKDSVGIADAFFRLGFYHRSYQNIEESIYNYYQSVKTFEAIKDTIEAGKKLVNLSNIFNAIGNYNEAEQTGVKALQYLENSSQNKYIAGAYNALAIASKQQKIYPEALHWYQKALLRASDSLSKIKISSNIAVTYLHQGDYLTAYTLLDSLQKNSQIQNDQELFARNLDNKAFSASYLGLPDAEKELLQALNLKKELKDESGQTTSYLHLATYYSNNRQAYTAQQMATQALALAKESNSTDDILEALALLINNTSNPKKYAQTYLHLTDSIQTTQDRLKNAFAKIKYDSEKTRAENIKLSNETKIKQLQLDKQRSRNILLTIILLIIILFWYLLTRYNKAKYQREKANEAYQTEMKISKKIHDELANDIFNIISFTENTTIEDVSKKQLLTELESVYTKARDISRSNGKIDFSIPITDNLQALINGYQNEQVNIICQGLAQLAELHIPEENQRAMYRTLQELLVNMKKHSEATIVVLRFTSEKKKITISYSDNGRGVEITRRFKTNGLLNVENRIESIGGSFTFDSTPLKGFKASIVIPA
ncbi:tetratricopeptide repeat-containing sensor histidine kinase [Joostella sp. CR20]|uniref:tetratricopeptide repeat-containing sensor histidine kinase n=1 Tax=Joostella sp. CR20 TaxID=2804312 RepID=UPI00313CC2CC